jgi:hypothetical protein
MTAIGSISINDTRVLVGDLALSNDPKYYSSIRRIPTRKNHSNIYPPDSPIIVLELMQKIFLINENIAIAWCGDVYLARKVIEKLNTEFKDRNFNCKDYNNIVKKLKKESDLSKLGLIVHYLVEGKLNIESRGCVSVPNSIHNYPDLFSGSGGESLKKINNTLKSNNINDSNAYLSSLFIQIMGADIYAPQLTLGRLFGGGFEAVIKKEEGFVKYGDISFLIWEALYDNNKVDGVSCIKIIKQYYYHDMLIIKEIVLDLNDNQPFWLHVVGNILEDSKEEDAKIDNHNDLSTKIQYNIFFLFDKNKRTLGSYVVVGFDKESQFVKIDFDIEGEISFEMNQEKLNQIISNLQRIGDMKN